jgi:hypothetical protein
MQDCSVWNRSGDVATDALGDRAQLGGDVDVYRRVQK